MHAGDTGVAQTDEELLHQLILGYPFRARSLRRSCADGPGSRAEAGAGALEGKPAPASFQGQKTVLRTCERSGFPGSGRGRYRRGEATQSA